MIVEDNGVWYVVTSVFNDKVNGPFDTKEDAEHWLRCYRHAEFLYSNGSDE